jgi:hypothetical protein
METNLKIIYNNLKDGDCLAFYRKSWYLQIIPFFTKEKNDKEAPQHVAICYEVKRDVNKLTFKLSEQNFQGGQYRDVVIYHWESIEKEKVFWTFDNYFLKQDKIVLLSLKQPLTAQQLENGVADAKSQVGKKYAFLSLPLGIEFLEKLLPKFLKNFIIQQQNSQQKRHCALHIRWNLYKMGVYNFKDFNPSPLEITKLPIFNVLV